ncbi:HlyD family type I secretion periplasmic adaptor subunit [Marinobacter sp. CA1]|uniref:HlyD family type I secretion periplasmic adaptor subunit n=1 Tax=Marinobacter sp. CA1 TaxID=2817656 RepID=UPI001D0749CA|nr:HlyD family type I secretion periplasmic adaptor subunit [Marinobacter sp. CA1]UDL03837.1 HlyD family type I secretion periplasmic adaptor subunit [Marinobacter sp. CA1]
MSDQKKTGKGVEGVGESEKQVRSGSADKGQLQPGEVAASEEQEWEEVDESTDLPGEFSRENDGLDQDALKAIPTGWSARVRTGIIILLVTFVGFGGWAAFAPLDGAAIATGQVMVESQNRVVQHLEGGIVADIRVQDGDQVQLGEPLIVLSDTRPKADLAIVDSQLDEVLGKEARLLAERVGAESINFPERLVSRQDQPTINSIISGQKELFRSRREGLEGRLAIYDQRVDALNEQMRGLESLRDNLRNRIASYEDELANWQALYDEELADRTQINEMQRQLFRLQGEKDSTAAQISELKVKVGETRSEMLVAKQQYAEEVAKELRVAQQSKSDLLARKVALEDTLKRTTISSPATGTVVGLTVHTIGGVVRPGDPLLEVVPTDQEYAIKARVQPQDIDRVAVGQLAALQLSAFNQQMAQVIEGEVTRISADAITDQQSGESFYEARVRVTEKGMERMKEQSMYLVPGMPASVLIKTGERTMLQYLMEPMTRMFLRAFREE